MELPNLTGGRRLAGSYPAATTQPATGPLAGDIAGTAPFRCGHHGP
ncbi:hypothetical protein HF872_10355 [Megasphaera hexanoica]|uniref:Uncharacterized protein n=1 Tax=Megasphaera hexanoica TaxID=1675036 RepID=A0A848C1C0_9FIRM|nr:hypothetical protein [Megasphaera hexanoica]NME29017.1 hypothetical protein [Megasphaera hexanoica]